MDLRQLEWRMRPRYFNPFQRFSFVVAGERSLDSWKCRYVKRVDAHFEFRNFQTCRRPLSSLFGEEHFFLPANINVVNAFGRFLNMEGKWIKRA